jgi:TolB protein
MKKRSKLLLITAWILVCAGACKNKSEKQTVKQDPDSPEGVISFLTTRDGNFEVYSMTADGKNLKNLSNNPAEDYWSSWSPDGKFLLFYSNRDGNKEIYRMNADGTNQINISNTPFNEYLPQWSPDGTKILFTSDKHHPSKEIYIMNADGSNVNRLTHDEHYNESPSWSPDMKKILYTKELRQPSDTIHASNGEIFLMDIDAKNDTRLTYKKGFDSGAFFSPDGKNIAFYGESETGNWDIFIMDKDGKNIQNITNDSIEAYSPTWSPNGKWIAYTAGNAEQYDVWIINLMSREKIRLTDRPKRNQNPVWRPDNKEN